MNLNGNYTTWDLLLAVQNELNSRGDQVQDLLLTVEKLTAERDALKEKLYSPTQRTMEHYSALEKISRDLRVAMDRLRGTTL